MRTDTRRQMGRRANGNGRKAHGAILPELHARLSRPGHKPTVPEVEQLASDLGLNQRERRFAELVALAPDPTPSELVDIARSAGYDGAERSLQTIAPRVFNRGRVRRYVNFLRAEAQDIIRAKGAGAVADVVECLEHLTAVKRYRLTDCIGEDGRLDVGRLKEAPAGIIKRLRVSETTDAEGQAYSRHEVDAESALRATELLLRHYAEQERLARPAEGPTVQVGVALRVVSAGALSEITAALQPAERLTDD